MSPDADGLRGVHDGVGVLGDIHVHRALAKQGVRIVRCKDGEQLVRVAQIDEPEDDEYDYMQIHNVEHYVSEMRWHARLNSHKQDVLEYLDRHGHGGMETMDLVERLETLEGEKVFPSFWLFHSPGAWDDYRYGDW